MNQHEQINYSIVIPVFNGSATIIELHDRLVAVMEKIDPAFEIILVDDGSKDDSWDVIQSIAEKDTRTIGLLLLRNSGQGNATIAGFQQSRGGLIITLDDDLQNPPEEIPKLINAMEKGINVDVVFGASTDTQQSFWRRWGSGIQSMILNALYSGGNTLKFTSFRLLRRAVAEPLFAMNVPVYAPGTLLGMITTRMINVEVEHHPRKKGKSGYSLTSLIRLTIARFMLLSLLPLRLLALIGAVGVLFSIIFGMVILYKSAFGAIGVPGWMTLALLLTFISGFNFLALGILGECVQSIMISVRKVPPYLVRLKTQNQRNGDQRTVVLSTPSIGSEGR